MRKSLLLILLLQFFWVGHGYSLTLYLDNTIEGAGDRALKACTDMEDLDRSQVIADSSIMYFEYDIDSSATENISTHPYTVEPTSGTGRWIEVLPLER